MADVRDRVADHVEQSAAAHRGVHPVVAGALPAVEEEAHVAGDLADRADAAGGEQLLHHAGLRVVAEDERLQQRDAELPAARRHARGAVGSVGERFLAEDRDAALGRLQGPALVLGVGQRHVHRVDRAAVEQLPVGAERPRRAVSSAAGTAHGGSERLRPLRVAAGDRGQLGAAHRAQRRDEDVGRDLRGTQDAPTDRRHDSSLPPRSGRRPGRSDRSRLRYQARRTSAAARAAAPTSAAVGR